MTVRYQEFLTNQKSARRYRKLFREHGMSSAAFCKWGTKKGMITEQEELKQHGMIYSISCNGKLLGNAPVERFFSSLK